MSEKEELDGQKKAGLFLDGPDVFGSRKLRMCCCRYGDKRGHFLRYLSGHKMIKNFRHICLIVKNLDRALEFYRDIIWAKSI
jgi:hypothetical protein